MIEVRNDVFNEENPANGARVFGRRKSRLQCDIDRVVDTFQLVKLVMDGRKEPPRIWRGRSSRSAVIYVSPTAFLEIDGEGARFHLYMGSDRDVFSTCDQARAIEALVAYINRVDHDEGAELDTAARILAQRSLFDTERRILRQAIRIARGDWIAAARGLALSTAEFKAVIERLFPAAADVEEV